MLIPKRILALAKCGDPTSSRFALGGLHFKRDAWGRPIAEATDGRKLIVATWEEPKDDEDALAPLVSLDKTHDPMFSAILPADGCAKVAKLGNGKRKRITATWEAFVIVEEPGANGAVNVGGACRSTLEPDTTKVRPFEGRFPNVNQAWPSDFIEAAHPTKVDETKREVIRPEAEVAIAEAKSKTFLEAMKSGNSVAVSRKFAQEAADKVAAEWNAKIQGKPPGIHVRIDLGLLRDAIDAMRAVGAMGTDGDTAILSVFDDETAIALTAAGDECSTAALIMPLGQDRKPGEEKTITRPAWNPAFTQQGCGTLPPPVVVEKPVEPELEEDKAEEVKAASILPEHPVTDKAEGEEGDEEEEDLIDGATLDYAAYEYQHGIDYILGPSDRHYQGDVDWSPEALDNLQDWAEAVYGPVNA